MTGTKYLWLYTERNLPAKHKGPFRALKALNLKTARAWAIKESLAVMWNYHRLGWATRFYTQWFFWATHSRLEPVIDVAYMIKRHLYGVLNYFSAARITNAAAEGLNSKIQTIENGLRLPESRALQDGHLLPLRRVRALPRYPLESRMTHIFRDLVHVRLGHVLAGMTSCSQAGIRSHWNPKACPIRAPRKGE